ncbi:MAG: hypothetical protein K9G76_10855 [Bacteroidales bacterium]|nr:hypothetical protein [Bacteroidales bacterium]MCF8404269.1 hypothetical protein [Bacteroidales bacterium]
MLKSFYLPVGFGQKEISIFINKILQMAGKTRKRKKIRYTKLTIKLSAKQKQSLINYCIARQTTPNKLIKKSIKRYINGFDKNVPDEFYTSEKQLDLFN